MMNFEEFIKKIELEIDEYFPADHRPIEKKIQPVYKTNHTTTCLILIEKDTLIHPSICLDDLYENFSNGISFSEICENVVALCMNTYAYASSLDYEKMLSWDFCKDKVYPHIINTEKNKEVLKNNPSKEIANLSIIYSIHMSEYASTIISEQMLSFFDITLEELHNKAISNLEKAKDGTICPLASIFPGNECESLDLYNLHLNICSIPEFLRGCIPDFYIISNRSGIDGSNIILDNNAMSSLYEEMGPEIYVIPSSRHEVIIMPINDSYDPQEIRKMITSVNATEVLPADFLSNNLYKISKETGLSIVA